MNKKTFNRMSEFGVAKIVNADFFTEDWIPQDEDLFECNSNDIIVYNHKEFEGGAMGWSTEMMDFIYSIHGNRKFTNCMEWCSGIGLQGFNLLTHEFCENLWLGDIYKPALRVAQKTIDKLPSKYQGRVDTIHMKSPQDIPNNLKFDLIIGSPIHWDNNDHPMINSILFNDRRSGDPDWLVHKEFFNNIKKNLANDGIIILQEQIFASGPKTFEKFITDGGLKIQDAYWEPENCANNMHLYYLEVVHA
jgi:hypothetical protein